MDHVTFLQRLGALRLPAEIKQAGIDAIGFQEDTELGLKGKWLQTPAESDLLLSKRREKVLALLSEGQAGLRLWEDILRDLR